LLWLFDLATRKDRRIRAIFTVFAGFVAVAVPQIRHFGEVAARVSPGSCFPSSPTSEAFPADPAPHESRFGNLTPKKLPPHPPKNPAKTHVKRKYL
jgi:hypothetical protein